MECSCSCAAGTYHRTNGSSLYRRVRFQPSITVFPATPIPPPTPHLLNSLISYWKCDDTSGSGTLVDSQGSNSLTGTGLTSNPQSPLTSFGNAQYTNLSSADWEHADNASLQVSGDFTFSLWVRVDTTATRYILCKWDMTHSAEYQLTHDATNGLSFSAGSAGTASVGAPSGTFAVYHIVAWY